MCGDDDDVIKVPTTVTKLLYNNIKHMFTVKCCIVLIMWVATWE